MALVNPGEASCPGGLSAGMSATDRRAVSYSRPCPFLPRPFLWGTCEWQLHSVLVSASRTHLRLLKEFYGAISENPSGHG